jgi:hypothetical protein
MPFQLNSERPKLVTEGIPMTRRLIVKAGRINHHPERRPGARPRRRARGAGDRGLGRPRPSLSSADRLPTVTLATNLAYAVTLGTGTVGRLPFALSLLKTCCVPLRYSVTEMVPSNMDDKLSYI